MPESTADALAAIARCEPLPIAGWIDLQADAAVLAALNAALNLELPLTPNRVVVRGELAACWIGPLHWLLRVALGDAATLVDRLLRAAEIDHAIATLMSDAFAGFRLAGPHAASVLAQGCPLDPDALMLGTCARSLLARAEVLLLPIGPPAAYEIWVERSHADYLRRWIAAAIEHE